MLLPTPGASSHRDSHAARGWGVGFRSERGEAMPPTPCRMDLVHSCYCSCSGTLIRGFFNPHGTSTLTTFSGDINVLNLQSVRFGNKMREHFERRERLWRNLNKMGLFSFPTLIDGDLDLDSISHFLLYRWILLNSISHFHSILDQLLSLNIRRDRILDLWNSIFHYPNVLRDLCKCYFSFSAPYFIGVVKQFCFSFHFPQHSRPTFVFEH